MGTVREWRFGGPPAPRYFLMVDLFDGPQRHDRFPSLLLRLARSDSQRWHGGELAIGDAHFTRQSRASTKHTTAVSKVSVNVRLSVQHKCHSVMPPWYQVLA